MSGELILAIDAGTQSVRAILFDLGGNPVSMYRVPLPQWEVSRPGWAEMDPGEYWKKLCEATRGLLNENRALRDAVRGVVMTSQRSTVVNVDSNGNPLRPAILWPDQRTTEKVPAMGSLWRLAFSVLGLGETVEYLQSQAEVNWIRASQPEIWNRTHKVLYLSGYLTYRLTGGFADSAGCQVGYMPFDYRRQEWAGRWDWKWRALAVDRARLPELVMPGQLLGQISREAAEDTGIPEGLPLVAAAADKACEVLGSGCLDLHQGSISYGTTATINVFSSRYIEPLPLIPPYPGAAPGGYNLEVQIYRGFWLVSWFIREFCRQELREAEDTGVAPEEIMDRLAAGVPPGSMGLVLSPYWSPGVKIPGPEAKGAVIGFRDIHSREYLYRALLEGLAYSLREGRERIERRTRRNITDLRVSGGGSRSPLVMQITADVFNLPAVRPHTWETSALGAAIVAAVGLKFFGDFRSAAGSMVRLRDTADPIPENVKIYDDLYSTAFRPLYGKLRPLYRAIRGIT